MPSSGVDFRAIRSHRNSQHAAFEELVRQLLVADPPAGCTYLEHRGPGADGGVEVLAHRDDGAQSGWQTKYFIDDFGADQIRQIDDSLRSALATYPKLTEYVVALPRNLSGAAEGKALSQRQRWERWKAGALASATTTGRPLAIELWDETTLLSRLIRPDAAHAGIRAYWFDQVAMTQDWFRERFASVRADLADRYSPGDHVDVTAQNALSMLTRDAEYVGLIKEYLDQLDGAGRTAERLRLATGDADEAAAAELVERSLREAAAIARALDWSMATEVDLGRVRDPLVSLQQAPTKPLLRRAGQHAARAGEEQHHAAHRRRTAWELESALDDLTRGPFGAIEPLLSRPTLVLLGEAGSGKSHSLAHLVDTHVAAGAAGVLLLGQHFGAGDPRLQLLQRLGLGALSFDVFLGALQAAALATGRPAVLAIDALNESRAAEEWLNTLAGLAADVSRFNRVALVVSCRSTYEAYCVPETLPALRLEHVGFEGDAARAAKVYLDKHGIDRPAAPFLDPEFTNPLFLSTCVRALRAENLRAFPLGLDGLSRLFDFWLSAVEKSLRRRGFAPIQPGGGVLRRALDRFAEQLALERREDLPLPQAKDIVEAETRRFAVGRPEDELLWRLFDEGVLRRDPTGSGRGETVAFTFQRFSDHFIADAVLRRFDSPLSLALALKAGGDMAHLLESDAWEYQGILEALMVQVPERFGVELADIEPDFDQAVRIPVDGFFESLRWRASGSTTAATVRLFERLTASRSEPEQIFDLLLHTSTSPDHALNAQYLHERLSAMAMPERDAVWTAYLYRALGADRPADTLIDWARDARTELAEPARVTLVAVALGWMLSAASRVVRDRATKALAALLLRNPAAMAPTIDRFADVDDAYVRERVLAAALGAATHLETDTGALRAAALAAYRATFAGAPQRHALIRDYARKLIDLAAHRTTLPSEIDLSRVLPPYASAPIEDWPTLDDLRPWGEEARSIIASVVGYLPTKEDGHSLAGDFGRYAMSSIDMNFSDERRGSEPARTRGGDKAAFWAALEAAGEELADLATAALKAHAAAEQVRPNPFLRLDLEEGGRSALPSGLVSSSAEAAASAAATLDAYSEALIARLPGALASQASHGLPFPEFNDDDVPTFSSEKARRWVAKRAIDLGWRKNLHEAVERSARISGDRHEHAVERIGKKYQWIAFHELVGYLADHHWYVDFDRQPAILDRFDRFEQVDIDASFLGAPRTASAWLQGLPRMGLPSTDHQADDAAAALAWTETLEDLPSVTELVEARAADGGRWWLVHAFGRDRNYSVKLDSEGPMRTGLATLDLVVLPTEALRRWHSSLRDTDIAKHELMRDQAYYYHLFGEHRAELFDDTDEWLNRTYRTLPFGRVALTLNPYRGEYDLSGLEDRSIEVPRKVLARAVDLRPQNAWSPAFVDGSGRLGFVDVGYADDSEAAPIVSADLLEPVLEAQGLTAAWLLFAEKDGGLARGKGARLNEDADRRSFGGLWWREGSEWLGSAWPAPLSWSHRRLSLRSRPVGRRLS